jgi:hypothetical protein
MCKNASNGPGRKKRKTREKKGKKNPILEGSRWLE